MFEEINAIQSRLAEAQQQIAALSTAPAPLPPAQQGSPSFGQALAEAQETSRSGSSPEQIGTSLTIGGQPVSVPPASLGPLPGTTAAPPTVSPGGVAPLPVSSNAESASGGINSLIESYASKHSISSALVKAVIQTESGGNPRAVSRAGAMGLMQLMPANVHEAGISDPFNPEQNIAAGTQQLAGLLSQYHGDLDLALAGYNAGPGNVRKYGGVPPFAETQQYIRKVRAAMEHE